MAEKDRVYQCLNPVGMQQPVDTFPLAPRLDTLDGKTIVISAAGEPDIMIPLEKRLRKDYPNVNWIKKLSYSTDVAPLSDEEMKTADALIQGVAW
ncbi:MAG: hypothetical protein JRJ85_16915 [Deltaproteobacteria bacterium]|nr:hypothetical protein [Deltaproteobacteria bacterium]